MSSLQGSLGDAFMRESAGNVVDAMSRQKLRSPIDNQPMWTTFPQDPAAQGKRGGVQELWAVTRHAAMQRSSISRAYYAVYHLGLKYARA